MSKKKWIELIKPHRHAGREYKPGQKINLAEDKADWLVSKEVGKETKEDNDTSAEKPSAAVQNATLKKE